MTSEKSEKQGRREPKDCVGRKFRGSTSRAAAVRQNFRQKLFLPKPFCMSINGITNEACATNTSPKDEEWRKKEKKGERLGHEGPKKRPQYSYFATESPFTLVPSTAIVTWQVYGLMATRSKANGAVLIKLQLKGLNLVVADDHCRKKIGSDIARTLRASIAETTITV